MGEAWGQRGRCAARQGGQRQWSLRATVDPNHSPQVEGDHYLSAATPAQNAVVEEITRDA
ncbi:hypothetical protein [Streptomyces sparsus]